MLADERITSIEVAQIQTCYPRTIGRNARLGSHGSGPGASMVVVRIDADPQAPTGVGLVAGDLSVSTDLIGLPVAEVFDPAIGVTDPRAAALDFALHDLAAKAAQVPLYTLLGEVGRPSVDCYSGAIYFDDLDPQEAPRGVSAILANCASDWEAGFRAFKLKIGRGNRWMEAEAGMRRDIEVTRAVREAYPEARILVDANDGFTPQQAVDYLRAVSDCGLYWIEEPFGETGESLRTLRDYLQESGATTLVADGEFEPDEAAVLELAGAGLIDVLLMDVVSYGLTAWRRVMPLVRSSGAVASPHAWGLPIKTLYAAQLAAGLGNVQIVEGVPGHTEGIDTGDYRLRDGSLHLPDTPGAGIALTATAQPVTEENQD